MKAAQKWKGAGVLELMADTNEFVFMYFVCGLVVGLGAEKNEGGGVMGWRAGAHLLRECII